MGWLVVWNMFYFPIFSHNIGDVIQNPLTHIFQDGHLAPPTREYDVYIGKSPFSIGKSPFLVCKSPVI